MSLFIGAENARAPEAASAGAEVLWCHDGEPRRGGLGRTELEGPKAWVPWLLLLVLAGASVLRGAGQTPGGTPGAPTRAGSQRKWYMLGRVSTLAGSPVHLAHIAVYIDTFAAPVQQLATSFQGEFELSLNITSDMSHQVRVVATKDGYHNATETVDTIVDSNSNVMDLVLRESEQDTDHLSLETLISSIAEQLQGSVSTLMPRPDWPDTIRRALALLDAHDTDSASQLLANAVQREPNCVEFRTLQALVMLEAGSWSTGNRLLTQAAALNASVDAKHHRSEPDLILGVLECWRGNFQRATVLFLQALNTDPQSRLLLQELGRAYLLQQNWPAADRYLARAIRAGAFPEAHLLRAEALLAEAKPREAEAECRTYLGGRKAKDLPRPIRLWWIRLNDKVELQIESEVGVANSIVNHTPVELLQALPELNGLEPARGQEELPSILQKVGERVEAFFLDFHNTSSREEVYQQLVRRDGRVKSSLHHNFQYLLVTWPDKSRPALEEYRTDPKGGSLSPDVREEDFMLTKGFASASQILLPAYQPESTFLYLGRQRLDRHETYVVAFAQRPEIARLPALFRAAGSVALTLSQGVVWVDCSTYQVLRMRTDLLTPVLRVQLNRETTEIHYGEIHFKDLQSSSWLPRDVVVTVEWKGKLLRNQHSYSDFHVFNVQSTIVTPTEPREGAR
jgi:tetratricopeptide (TPR) repeat protein